MVDSNSVGRVTLVGAGPGDPLLLTLRGLQCLQTADLVIYDQLVAPELLDLAPSTARRLGVQALHPHHPERAPLVIQAVLDGARSGLHVVRLKGGDPFLFGRGGEECEALRAAGIPFEVVPGISAALGAAAYTGIPLTHRAFASSVTLVTGHEHPDKDEPVVDWESLARLHGTLAIYMGLNRLGVIAQRLIAAGRPGTTPVAAIELATTGSQRVLTAPLERIADEVTRAQFRSPTVVLIGEVVALRERIAWFEARPLYGQRILVTRPRGQADEMTRLLKEQGAVVAHLPAVAIGPPLDWGPVDSSLANLGAYQWVVFTSANGVRFFMDRLRAVGRDLRALGGVRLAVIGPATATVLREYHLEPDAIPDSYRSEELAATLLPLVAGQRVLLARADRGREILREELARVARVEQIAVYSQVDAIEADRADSPALQALRRGEVDWITLTSPNIARALAAALDAEEVGWIERGRTRLASISPVTSAAVAELGWRVSSEATEYTASGVVRAIQETVTAERTGRTG
jgi:uroporphyrinogen III methyltransferase/synthase